MLELDHAICFVGAAGDVDLSGFAVEPGRVHAGQGTRNVRVMFDRNYLEVLWIEDAGQVAARGLDFGDRCARPARAVPFGVVLRGAIPEAQRARFVPYLLSDAPDVVLHLLAAQPPDAPFVAVFDGPGGEARWPGPRVAPAYLAHANGATRIVRATFTAPARPPLDELADVAFAIGAPHLALDLGGTAVAYAG